MMKRLISTDQTRIPEIQRKILSYLAMKGPQTKYKIEKETRINHASVHETVEKLKILGIIKGENIGQTRTGLKKVKYWLTAKALIYAAQQGLIDSKKTQSIEKRHNIEVPCKFHCGRPFANPENDCDCVKSFKARYPEVFFRILTHMPNILESREEDLSKFSCLSAILGSFYLFLSDPEYHKECLEAQDLEAGCHGIAIDPDDESTANPFVSPIAEVIFKVLGVSVPKLPSSATSKD
jgi:hypothetical protein